MTKVGTRAALTDDEIVDCMKRVLFLEKEELIRRVGESYFNSLGIPNYAFRNEHVIRVLVRQTRRIMALTQAEGKHILEIGAGIGLNAIISVLAGAGRVTAMDFIEPQTEVMKKMIQVIDEPVLSENITVVCGDATKMSFQDDAFDVIEIMDMLSHCQDLDALVRQIKRVARHGATIYILDGNNALKFGAAKEIEELQEAAEHGPLDAVHAAGRAIGITEPYVETRARMIRERYPELSAEAVAGLARDTVGLYGEAIFRRVDLALSGKAGPSREPTFPDVCVGKPRYRNPENGMWPEVAFSPPKLRNYLRRHGINVRLIPYRHTVFTGGTSGAVKRALAKVLQLGYPTTMRLLPGFELLGQVGKSGERRGVQ